jgi:hypothetical protein
MRGENDRREGEKYIRKYVKVMIEVESEGG